MKLSIQERLKQNVVGSFGVKGEVWLSDLRIGVKIGVKLGGESTRGVSPLAARRTVREPLGSYRSH